MTPSADRLAHGVVVSVPPGLPVLSLGAARALLRLLRQVEDQPQSGDPSDRHSSPVAPSS